MYERINKGEEQMIYLLIVSLVCHFAFELKSGNTKKWLWSFFDLIILFGILIQQLI